VEVEVKQPCPLCGKPMELGEFPPLTPGPTVVMGTTNCCAECAKLSAEEKFRLWTEKKHEGA
jgi:endogenous inhibitor of DNA gyrase (YacG/DUF329 family)